MRISSLDADVEGGIVVAPAAPLSPSPPIARISSPRPPLPPPLLSSTAADTTIVILNTTTVIPDPDPDRSTTQPKARPASRCIHGRIFAFQRLRRRNNLVRTLVFLSLRPTHPFAVA